MFVSRGVNCEQCYIPHVVRYRDIAFTRLGTFILRFLIKCAPKFGAGTRSALVRKLIRVQEMSTVTYVMEVLGVIRRIKSLAYLERLYGIYDDH